MQALKQFGSPVMDALGQMSYCQLNGMLDAAYLLKRPVGRRPNEVRRFYANFTYQAGSWTKPCRVTAKVEWHPGELASQDLALMAHDDRLEHTLPAVGAVHVAGAQDAAAS